MTRNDSTTISLDRSTRDRLKDLGAKGETYDDILRRLLDDYERGADVTVTVREPAAPPVIVPFEEIHEPPARDGS